MMMKIIIAIMLATFILVNGNGCIDEGRHLEKGRKLHQMIFEASTLPPENFTGVWKEYYENKRLYGETEYVNGKLNGIRKTWYPYRSHHQMTEEEFLDGKRHGAYTKWRSTGVLYEQGTYINGLQEGKWTHYHHNGVVYSINQYVNGKKHGLYESWESDGRKSGEGNYQDGKAVGRHRAWFHGKLYYDVDYENGEIVYKRMALGKVIEHETDTLK